MARVSICSVSMKTTTMARPPSRKPVSAKGPTTGSLVWKSTVLALSMATVAVGSMVLARKENTGQAAQSPAPQVIVVQMTAAPKGFLAAQGVPLDSAATASLASIPALPQRPVFRQPITRTRAS
jgi:hypothetical protein